MADRSSVRPLGVSSPCSPPLHALPLENGSHLQAVRPPEYSPVTLLLQATACSSEALSPSALCSAPRMAEQEHGPLGSAALRSSVALDARGFQWSLQALQAHTDQSAEGWPASESASGQTGQSSGTARGARQAAQNLPGSLAGEAVSSKHPQSKIRWEFQTAGLQAFLCLAGV